MHHGDIFLKRKEETKALSFQVRTNECFLLQIIFFSLICHYFYISQRGIEIIR